MLGILLYHRDINQTLSHWDFLLQLRTYVSPQGKLLSMLPDLSHNKLNKVLALLKRAGCLYWYNTFNQPTICQPACLRAGIDDFGDLRRVHDQYLLLQMGREAPHLQGLLWPVDGPVRAYMLDGMNQLVSEVKRALARGMGY